MLPFWRRGTFAIFSVCPGLSRKPGLAEKGCPLGRARATRNGRLNDSRVGIRMRGEGPIADLIRQVSHVNCRQLGLNQRPWPVSAEAFTRPSAPGREQQLRLFE